jgi:hypothetical protein
LIDQNVIDDGMVHGATTCALSLGHLFRMLQSGVVRNDAAAGVVLGAVFIFSAFSLFRRWPANLLAILLLLPLVGFALALILPAAVTSPGASFSASRSCSSPVSLLLIGTTLQQPGAMTLGYRARPGSIPPPSASTLARTARASGS